MPPQPLSKVRPKAKVLPAPETLYSHRPWLAPLAMAVIAHWSEIEAKTAAILTYVLHAEAKPTMAMIQAIRSASAQMDMVESAGIAKLDGQDLEIFGATLRLARIAAKKRHPIAHHIWAFDLQMTDAIFLVEPSAYLEMYTQLADGSRQLWEPDRNRVMVYRQRDFEEIIAEMKTVARCIDLASWALNGRDPVSPKTYELLFAEPLFQEALKWTRKNRPRPAE